jgi:hypothetical protein
VRSSNQLNDQLYEVSPVSNEVRGYREIHLLVLRNYSTSSYNRRYRLFYLLHG